MARPTVERLLATGDVNVVECLSLDATFCVKNTPERWITMVATTCADKPLSLSETADEDLVFRICTAPREGQIVRLKSTKCTIGSGPRCTLRLRASGVSPLHCLIVRGTAATIIRRWSPDTRLNDQTFTDAELAPGDRLGIGPVDLEVIAVHSAKKFPTASRQEAIQPPPPDMSLERSKLELEQQRCRQEEQQRQWQREREEIEAKLTAEQNQISNERQRLEAENRSLADQRRQWESEHQETVSRLTSQVEQLAAEQKSLVAEKQSLTEQQRQWELERQELAAKLALQTEQLAAEQKKLEVEKQSFTEQQRQWETTHQETAAGLATQNEQISAALADLQAQKQLLADQQRQLEAQAQQSVAVAAETETERQSLAGQRQQWQAEQADAQRQLDQQCKTLNARNAELAAKQAAFEEQCQAWERQRAEAASEPAASEPTVESEATGQRLTHDSPATTAPVDLAEVFRRVGATVDLVDEAQDPTIEPTPSSRREPKKTLETLAVAADSNEESIDDYMNRLMKRLRSSSGDAATPAYVSPPSRSSANVQEPAKPAAEPEQTVVSEPSTSTSAEPLELSPRTMAPERNVDFSALRELANLSAQSAISQHARQVLIHAMYSKLVVTLVSLAAGTTLLWMWKTLGSAQTTFYAALVAILVAIYWGMEYALLSGRLTIGKTGHLEIDWSKSPAHAGKSGDPKPTGDDATSHA